MDYHIKSAKHLFQNKRFISFLTKQKANFELLLIDNADKEAKNEMRGYF